MVTESRTVGIAWESSVYDSDVKYLVGDVALDDVFEDITDNISVFISGTASSVTDCQERKLFICKY